MKKYINRNYFKYNFIFIFLTSLIFGIFCLHYNHMKIKVINEKQNKVALLFEKYREDTAKNLKKNSERYIEYGLVDKGEFDYLLINQNNSWKSYNVIQKEWNSIDLDNTEKMFLGENTGIINYKEKCYIYGGFSKDSKYIFSLWEVNRNYLDVFFQNIGIEIKEVEGKPLFYQKKNGEEIEMIYHFVDDVFKNKNEIFLLIYSVILMVFIFIFSYIINENLESIEEKLVEDIDLIRKSNGKESIEVPKKVDFYRVKVSLGELGKIYCKKIEEVNKLKGELTKINLELRELAITDKLTGLYNKRFLYEMLENLKKETVELPYHNILMMIDLDNFKTLNDTEGHQAGDVLLKSIGDILKDVGRGRGTAFRYGGDEFLIIFKKLKYEDFLDVISEFELSKKNIMARYRSVKLGISAGVILLDSKEMYEPDTLIREVDDLLYEAKQNGKNQIVFKL